MENVLVVKATCVAPYIPKKGLNSNKCDEAISAIMENHTFLPRNEAENDPSYKQVIPYVIVRRGGRIFVTRRLSKSTETRLHGRLSIGVGGHINLECDNKRQDILIRGLWREIDEEISMTSACTLTPAGLINDDTNEVGSVHLGLLYFLDTDGDVKVRETEKLSGEWIPARQLPQFAEEMETWSQIALSAL